MHWATGIIVPILLTWLFFLCVFTCIPHTPVPVRHAWWPSLLASFCIMLLQMVYIHLQVLVSSYSIIYGSLAAIPLFLLWLQISWYIIIGCAELTHANQDLAIGNVDKTNSHIDEQIIAQCLIILDLLIDRQRSGLVVHLPSIQLQQRTHFSRPELLHCLARMEAGGVVRFLPPHVMTNSILLARTRRTSETLMWSLPDWRTSAGRRWFGQVTDAKIRRR